jgi:hypothetical protein
MAAAFRLADILTLREQREIAELKAAARAESATTPSSDPEPLEAEGSVISKMRERGEQTLEPREDTSKEVFAAILNRVKTDVAA